MNIIEAVNIAEQKYQNKIKRKDWDFILYAGGNSLWVWNANKSYKLNVKDILADDWEVVGLKDDKTEQTKYIGPMILVQIISNSVEKLEKEGIEALFNTYPEWFKNAICSGKVKVLTIENELIFKVKTFRGEEVNVFLNDFIGKSDVEGEVYPWFYIHLD